MATDTKKDAKAPEAEVKPKITAKFTGSSVVERIITAQDFKSAGIDDVQTLTWNEGNDHTVDVSDLPAEAVDLLKKQPNFKITEG